MFFALMSIGARGVGERELECEEAAVRLQDCCDDFDPTTMSCAYEWSCGGDGDLEPSLRTSTAECIQGLSCEELNASGVCHLLLLMEEPEEDEVRHPGSLDDVFAEVCS